MRVHALVAVAFALSFAAAGCIGHKPDAPVDANQAPTPPTNVSVAPDGRGGISAFNETNRTETTGIGSMVHTHDFWKGKERLDNVAWIRAGQIPLPLLPCKKADNSCTVGGTTPNTDTYPAATAIVDYDLKAPPEMGMIYEGTKTVEVKLTEYYSESVQGNRIPGNPAGHVFFDYLAANDEPGHFHSGGQLDLNVPVKIDIKPTDADMPHQTKSLWVFRVYSDSQMVIFFGNITISLVKGYDVVNWPPHPNLYADKPQRTVYEGPVKLASKGSVDTITFGSDAGWLSPQKVISWGTDRLEVEATNVKFSSSVPGSPQPKAFPLEFRNASAPFLMANFANWVTMTDPAGSPATGYRFTIDLTKDRGDAYDTPYAQYSRWGFRLIPVWDTTVPCADSLTLADCQWFPWEMTYDLKITAYGHSTATGVPAGSA